MAAAKGSYNLRRSARVVTSESEIDESCDEIFEPTPTKSGHSDSDSDFSPKKKIIDNPTNKKKNKGRKRKNETEKENNEESEAEPDSNEYEAIRKKNIEEKMAFLKKLNFSQFSTPSQSKPKKQPKKIYMTPRPKSLRIQNLPSPDINISPASTDIEKQWEKPKRNTTEIINASDINENNNAESLKAINDSLEAYSHGSNNNYFDHKSAFKNMHLENLIKTVPSRISSIAIHPMSDILIAAGDKFGNIGLINKGQSHIFQPNSGLVSCLKFHSNKPELYSTSYDGTIRCFNINTSTFNLVHSTASEETCHYFDFISDDSMIVGHDDGSASILDLRTDCKEKSENFQLESNVLKTVHVHPIEKHYFLTASNSKNAAIWDLRYLSKTKAEPVSHTTHGKSVNSAFFSPLTGKSILTVSYDDKIRVFDSAFKNVKTTIRHCHATGRWLTPFKAVWLPNNEQLFAVGSMTYPRRIEVFNVESGQEEFLFNSDKLTTICSLVEFHPHLPVLIGGNSSGKIAIFSKK